MAKIKDVVAFLHEIEETFIERHQKYGHQGMNQDKCLSLLSTKLDRLQNGGFDHDTAIDIAGYALISLLLGHNVWDLMDEQTSTIPYTTLRAKRLRLDHDGICRPQKDGDAGFDLVTSKEVEVPPLGCQPVNVPFDVAIKLPDGYWAEIRPRSSTSTRLGVWVHQSVMDSGYTGPWFGICSSITNQSVQIPSGTRLAQCIIHKAFTPDILWVDTLPITARGENGFGSTSGF